MYLCIIKIQRNIYFLNDGLDPKPGTNETSFMLIFLTTNALRFYVLIGLF